MVYRRRIRRFRRKSGYRRRPFTRYRKTFRKRVRKAQLQNSELKQANTQVNAAVSSGFQYYNMSPNIPQGAGDNERIGNEIMSRNFQIKCRINARIKQNPVGPGTSNIWARILIVYPRKYSNVEAQNFITALNFPGLGLIDQDNWIVWYDKWVTLNPNSDFYHGYPKTLCFKFNKRFYSKMIFGRGASVQPEKGPWMIINHDSTPTDQELTFQGYFKLSYKDI